MVYKIILRKLPFAFQGEGVEAYFGELYKLGFEVGEKKLIILTGKQVKYTVVVFCKVP